MSASDVIRAATEPRRDPLPEAEIVLAGTRQREALEAKARKHEAADVPPAVMNFYNSRHQPVPAEPPMSIGGPSFLGLSGSSRGYEMEEDRPASITSKLFLLVVLAALGYAVYRNWEPIRGYVGEAFGQVKTVTAPAPAQSTPDSGAPTAAPEASSTPVDQTPTPTATTPAPDNTAPPASASPTSEAPTDAANSPVEAPAPKTARKAHGRRRAH